MTTGIEFVAVARFAARAPGTEWVTMTSTLSRTSSAASAGKTIVLTFRKAKLEGDILALNISQVAQPRPECVDARGPRRGSGHSQEPDPWDSPGLLGEAIAWPAQQRGHRNQQLPASRVTQGASPSEPAG